MDQIAQFPSFETQKLVNFRGHLRTWLVQLAVREGGMVADMLITVATDHFLREQGAFFSDPGPTAQLHVQWSKGVAAQTPYVHTMGRPRLCKS